MTTARAMVLEAPGSPLVLRERPLPQPGPGEVRIEVSTCGVCRTDLHLLDAELPDIHYPIVPGHQIVGRVQALGPGVDAGTLKIGDRVGVPWLGGTCGHCDYCLHEQENLCDDAQFTGYQLDGGYATHCIAKAAYCLPLPETMDDQAVAPLLCGGLIGYRCLRMCGDAKRIGMYGFGAAAHQIAQVAIWQQRDVYAFTRAGDTTTQAFARSLGAVWAGESGQTPPQKLDAAILFAPAGELVPMALRAVRKGGRVICGGIHMSDIPSFPYDILWGERSVMSVANLTRADGHEFLTLAAQVPVQTQVTVFALDEANEALDALRNGRFEGAAVLDMRR
ncbi:zinc-dependent alcohol dehydrogenase family protein [Sinimarinibacterium sp. CAU 1509]|uniref:zinc-dependent alcohol dehydrogenase family protein n=1 Tax=Sinimarinibacterium sp. CAU 1509 TaxID=2562283 RepID=UPI00200A9A16|nr:zinc-dependent alcohol dehydrogenase family protein [Sinimarinibacterium sp. CAU 1509]